MELTQVVVDGTLRPDGTLLLDEKPNLPPGRVRVTVQAAAAPVGPEDGVLARLQRIWAEQEARGDAPRTREEVDAEINALRDEAEEEMKAIERLYGECERSRRSTASNEEPGR
jgi:hypothetical protein